MNHDTRTPRRSDSEARLLLTFFASMAWQDGQLHREDHDAICLLASELGLAADDLHVDWMLQTPPLPEEVDPQRVPRALASAVVGMAALAAGVRPSLAKYEALELLELLLQPELPTPAVYELLAA